MSAQQTIDEAIAFLRSGQQAAALGALSAPGLPGLDHAATAVDLCLRESTPTQAIALLNDVRPIADLPARVLKQIALDLMALDQGQEALDRLAAAGKLMAADGDRAGFEHLLDIAELIVGGDGRFAPGPLDTLATLDPARAERWTRLARQAARIAPATVKKPEAGGDHFRRGVELAGKLATMRPEAACTIVERLDLDHIKSAYAGDAWLRNYYVNMWEYVHKADVLESYPWNVALPLADLCNARCSFCTSWLMGRQVLQPDQLDRYLELLKYARMVGIQGHGEPLANPHIDTILQRVAGVLDRRAHAYIITNGMFLRKRLGILLNAKVYTYHFSLNATTNAAHDKVMGLGEHALDEVLEAVKTVLHLRDTRAPGLFVAISMVLTSDNIHEAPAFVRLGNALGVNRVYLRTLAPQTSLPLGLNYHKLPPHLHPDFARLRGEAMAEIAKARVQVEASPELWAEDALTPALRASVAAAPPREFTRREAMDDPAVRHQYRDIRDAVAGHGAFVADPVLDAHNPFGRTAPFDCRFVYQQFMSTQLTFRIVPCCYITDVPGHEPVVFDGTRPFMEYWNSPAFVSLRRSLRDGPLHDACKTCPMQGNF